MSNNGKLKTKSGKHLLDPRQANFIQFYLDPKSPTHANAYRSALKAGYKQEYAENIKTLAPEWLLENIEGIVDTKLITKAVSNLDEFLTTSIDSSDSDKKIRLDATKFTLSTLARSRFHTKTESETTNHNKLEIKIINNGGIVAQIPNKTPHTGEFNRKLIDKPVDSVEETSANEQTSV